MSMKNAHEEIYCQGPLARPCYFPGLLVTPEVMILEQEYFRNRLRLHNRMLHGWGVVCGALVCRIPRGDNEFEPWKVMVKPGYALGPYGDEILLDCPRELDLRGSGVSGLCGESSSKAEDPWCSTGPIERDRQSPLYVAIRYKEFKTDPVRTQPPGCGCDETQCEYSRCRDGYQIGILSECPESHRNPPPPLEIEEWEIPQCPPCPDCPWVVLAEVHVDRNGRIERIDNCTCRRLVLTLGHFWMKCRPPQVESVETSPATIRPGTAEVDFSVRGEFFRQPLRAKFILRRDGETAFDEVIRVIDEIELKEVEDADGREMLEARFTAGVPESADIGVRDLMLFNADGSSTVFSDALEVKPPTGGKKSGAKKAPAKKTAAKKTGAAKKTKAAKKTTAKKKDDSSSDSKSGKKS